jgi:Ran GTPase-activating protein (RanGAP) involved in mRNA processing and transport
MFLFCFKYWKRKSERMSVSNDSTLTGTIDDGRALLSSTFLDFCIKVRNNDPSILPECGKPFEIRHISEKESIELAEALLENTSVTYLKLNTAKYTKSAADAMAKFVRTSKHLQHIRWDGDYATIDQEWRSREEIFSCIMLAIQESTSLKELHMELPSRGGPSNLALENMLTHTQSLRSLSLRIPPGHIDVAAVESGLKKNTTVRELTLEFSWGAATVPSILTSLRDHPLLRRLCLRGHALDLTGLEALLLSEASKITELDIGRKYGSLHIGLPRILRALAQRPTMTKLELRYCPLGCDMARLLQLTLCKLPNLHSLILTNNKLGSAGLAELAPALSRNASIKVLDMSFNYLRDMESAKILRDILRSNKTMTTLDLTSNAFGQTTGAVECIANGLDSNSTLLKIDPSRCSLGDTDVSTLAQSLGFRNTTLQKLSLGMNSITSTGLGALLETMEQSSNSITDLDLRRNHIGDEGANLLARSLGNNALPNLTRLSLFECGISYDGFIALMSALEQNTSLLQLDLRSNRHFSERAFLALAESLPEIKVLQQLDLDWCESLASAMPLLLTGLRTNTSLFHFHLKNCAPVSVPPRPEERARCAGGWMQEMERLGYRNRCLVLIRTLEETHQPRGIWPHVLAWIAAYPDHIFEVLHSKFKLVSPEGTEGKETAEDPGVPKRAAQVR